MKKTIRIATRKSELALWQARHVESLLLRKYPETRVELVPLLTQGDRILDRPLAEIGGKGLFLKELEVALLNGDADLAVHSMKDVPVVPTPGLLVDVVLERANPFDAVLSHGGESLSELPPGSRIGTSSLRRQCQLRAQFPGLSPVDLRGNVNTRIRKLNEGQYAAIILACAGLERLGLGHLVNETLHAPEWLPAVTQGVICLQYREADDALAGLLQPLNHDATALCAKAERSVSLQLEGSCQLPLAVFARIEESELLLDAMIGSIDGAHILRSHHRGPVQDAASLANQVAADLLSQGAAGIIEGLRSL